MKFIVSVTILFNLWPDIVQGIMADDNLKVHYRQKGSRMCFTAAVSPVQLNSKKSWKVENIVIADSQKGVNPSYKMRADYNSTDHTLCIRELDTTDQGDYVAVYENWTEEQVAKHRLIVENAVPAVVIRITRLSSKGSAGFCNVTVNCTVLDDSASFVCDKHYCTGSQLWSSTKVNITVSNNKGTILCTGNNHVSTNTTSASIKGICFSENDSHHLAYTLAICGGVILCVLIWVIKKYPLSIERTAQQQLCGCIVSHPPQANTIYETVEQSQRCQVDDAATTSQEIKKSKASPQAESVYSTIQLPAGVNPSDNNAIITSSPAGMTEAASPGKKVMTSVCKTVDQYLPREGFRSVQEERTAGSNPEQPLSLYYTIQPVTQPTPVRSPEDTGRSPSLVGAVNNDEKYVEHRQVDRGGTTTSGEAVGPQCPLQAETVYSTVQKGSVFKDPQANCVEKPIDCA